MLTLISGVIGLTTAIQLLEKGEKVTIVTKNLSYSCSQVAGLILKIEILKEPFLNLLSSMWTKMSKKFSTFHFKNLNF
jgi:hypothetical protein